MKDDKILEKAIEVLRSKYEYAKSQPFVFHPIGYALYHTWKEFDRR